MGHTGHTGRTAGTRDALGARIAVSSHAWVLLGGLCIRFLPLRTSDSYGLQGCIYNCPSPHILLHTSGHTVHVHTTHRGQHTHCALT